MSAVKEGRFREDLLARINLWTFLLPGLRERREDIVPNLQFELDQFAQRTGHRVTLNKEARQRFLQFALSPAADSPANFRDLNAAVARMATLAAGGRISVEIVEKEIAQPEASWTDPRKRDSDCLEELQSAEQFGEPDAFDRVQLAHVVDVCRRSRALSKAGRVLFSASLGKKSSSNDADRLRKYLGRFGMDWALLRT